jgi:hypothetical protein
LLSVSGVSSSRHPKRVPGFPHPGKLQDFVVIDAGISIGGSRVVQKNQKKILKKYFI